jgi:hypothetical protein
MKDRHSWTDLLKIESALKKALNFTGKNPKWLMSRITPFISKIRPKMISKRQGALLRLQLKRYVCPMQQQSLRVTQGKISPKKKGSG